MVCETKNTENSKRCSKFTYCCISTNSNSFSYRWKNIIFTAFIFLALSALKIKGLTAFQIWQIWRLLNYLRATGRYSHFGKNNQTQPSSSLSIDDAYKILGIKKGCSKEDVIKATNGLQKKIHPDVNPNSNTERLSQIVNEAKETILKFDFS